MGFDGLPVGETLTVATIRTTQSRFGAQQRHQRRRQPGPRQDYFATGKKGPTVRIMSPEGRQVGCRGHKGTI